MSISKFIRYLINKSVNQSINRSINQTQSIKSIQLHYFNSLYLILGLLKKVGFENSDGPEGGLSLNDSTLTVYKDYKKGKERSGVGYLLEGVKLLDIDMCRH